MNNKDKFISEDIKVVGHDEVNDDDLNILSKIVYSKKSMVHGGPGSGRYPKGSGDNEVSPDIPSAKDSLKIEKGSSYISSAKLSSKEISDQWMAMTGRSGSALGSTNLSEPEKDSVLEYIQAGYAPINAYARHGTMEGAEFIDYAEEIQDNETAKRYVENLDKAIERGGKIIPVGTEMWRGIGEHSGARVAALEIGDICDDKAFQSFSTDPYSGGNFARAYEMPKTDPDPNILAPIGKTIIRAISTGTGEKALGGSMTERELIFPRGTKWQVVSKEQFDLGKDIKLNVVTVMHHE